MLHDMTADYHRHGVIGRGVFQHPAAWSLGPMVICTRIYKKCSASFKSSMVSKIQLKNLGRSSTLSQTKHLAMKSFSLQDLPELNFSSETSSERNAFRPILGQQPHYTSPLLTLFSGTQDILLRWRCLVLKGPGNHRKPMDP